MDIKTCKWSFSGSSKFSWWFWVLILWQKYWKGNLCEFSSSSFWDIEFVLVPFRYLLNIITILGHAYTIVIVPTYYNFLTLSWSHVIFILMTCPYCSPYPSLLQVLPDKQYQICYMSIDCKSQFKKRITIKPCFRVTKMSCTFSSLTTEAVKSGFPSRALSLYGEEERSLKLYHLREFSESETRMDERKHDLWLVESILLGLCLMDIHACIDEPAYACCGG